MKRCETSTESAVTRRWRSIDGFSSLKLSDFFAISSFRVPYGIDGHDRRKVGLITTACGDKTKSITKA